MFAYPQIQYSFPEPHHEPMMNVPGVPSFPSPEYPVSFESPESPTEDCIVVSLQEQEDERPSRPDNRRRSARLNSKPSSNKSHKSGASQRQKLKLQRKTMPLQPGEHLSKPLSKLALEMPRIPKFDMHAFLRRGADKRVGRESRISRPNNPFLLYRKAYYLYATALSKSANRRNARSLSRMIGASYRSEDQEVRDQFARYAAIEKEQHCLHFPDYKFNPKKYSAEY